MRKVLKTAKTKNGNLIELVTNGEISDNNVLIIGVFHGDEPQGKYLIERYFEEDVISGNLIFIPCLNPDGMAQNSRTNSNGVDLNRNFPTKNWGEDGSAAGEDTSAYFGGTAPASEIETRFVIDVIEEYKPKLILTLHAPYKVVNYDGPAKEIAEEISEIIKYPVEASIGYPTPGSFGTYCGVERSIPTITLELDEEIPVEELLEPVHTIFDILI